MINNSLNLAGYNLFLANSAGETAEQNGEQNVFVNGELVTEVPEAAAQGKMYSLPFSQKNEGSLSLNGKEYAFYTFVETASSSEGVFKFLKNANHSQKFSDSKESPRESLSSKHEIKKFETQKMSGLLESKPEAGKDPVGNRESRFSPSLAKPSLPSAHSKTATETKQAPAQLENSDPHLPSSLVKSAQSFKSVLSHLNKNTNSENKTREQPATSRDLKQSSPFVFSAPTSAVREFPQERYQNPEREKQKEDQEGHHQQQEEGEQAPDTYTSSDEEAPSATSLEVTSSDPLGRKSFPRLEASGGDDPPDEIREYGLQESLLSQIVGMRVSNFDVLHLFFEILKLAIKDRDSETISRREERLLQLEHMHSVVENYQSQGKWLLTTTIMSGVLGIVSGIAPILGHMKGDWILEKLSGFFTSLKDMEKDKFFKGIMKITQTMSEIQKGMGQVQQTFAEGSRTRDEQMGRIHETQKDERTRAIEDLKDQWKGIENFLLQMLQMLHDQIRQLYN